MTDTLARALEPSDSGMDRRKLLKVGAWAAPVVVLAAAVPAASASVKRALSFDTVPSLHFVWSTPSSSTTGDPTTAVSGIGGKLKVKYVDAGKLGGSLSSIAVTLTLAGTGLSAGKPSIDAVSASAGWSARENNPGGVYVFTYGGAVAPDGETPELNFTITGSGFAVGSTGADRTWSTVATHIDADTGSSGGNRISLLRTGAPTVVVPATNGDKSVSGSGANRQVTLSYAIAANKAFTARIKATPPNANHPGAWSNGAGGAATINVSSSDLGNTSASGGVLRFTFPRFDAANGGNYNYVVSFYEGTFTGEPTTAALATREGFL